MVGYSDGGSMGYVLFTRSTIRKPDQNIIIQDGIDSSGIQVVRLDGILNNLNNTNNVQKS